MGYSEERLEKVERIKELIREYHDCPEELDITEMAIECYYVAKGLCPNCGADAEVWKEMLHEKHKCPKKVAQNNEPNAGNVIFTSGSGGEIHWRDARLNQEEPTELDNDLEERLLSIEKMLELGRLALTSDNHELISTALESAFEKLQYVLDDYCVK